MVDQSPADSTIVTCETKKRRFLDNNCLVHDTNHHQQSHQQPQQQQVNSNLSTNSNKSFPPRDSEYSYGLCSFEPAWLQKLATKQSFLVIFCLTSILQGMYYTYFVAVLTTIERLYQIQSKTTGLVMSATEIGQIGGALFLSYYGGQGHRPKWISAGILVFAFASILSSAPHFIYGRSNGGNFEFPPPSTDAPSLIHDSSSLSSSSYNISRPEISTSHAKSSSTHLISSLLLCNEMTNTSLSSSSSSPSVNCSNSSIEETQSHETRAVLLIFFFSLFFIGIGATAVNTLGIPYIDDNVAPRESPLYFGPLIPDHVAFYRINFCVFLLFIRHHYRC